MGRDKLNPGLFISFEGIEGGGKTSHISRLAQFFSEKGYDVQVTREPGGSPAAEAARHVLLSGGVGKFGPCAEAIMFASVRCDHIETIIRPALMQGKVLLCDRFLDSSYAYQSKGDEFKRKFVDSLQKVSVQEMMPDYTIILDLPVDVGLQRVHRRHVAKETNGLDHFEREDVEIHEMRRRVFLEIAQEQPERCHVVDATNPFEDVAANILKIVHGFVRNRDSVLRKK
ncbi:dTMP kinase [Liberibacter sp. Z1]|nr:dTMP kinase [Candidatus Liberibacter sp.]